VWNTFEKSFLAEKAEAANEVATMKNWTQQSFPMKGMGGRSGRQARVR
jgi:hypothetical protein